jgi:hypothetical protein
MKCLSCGSGNVTDHLAIEDDGAHRAGNHKVTMPYDRTRTSKASGSRVADRACIDCGCTALFAEDPTALVSSELA